MRLNMGLIVVAATVFFAFACGGTKSGSWQESLPRPTPPTPVFVPAANTSFSKSAATADGFTIAVRVRPDALGRMAVVVPGAGQSSFALGTSADGRFVFSVGASSVTSRIAYEPGTWYRLAAVCDGDALRLYVDGVEAGEAEADGAGQEAGGFIGAVEDLRLLDRALTGAEVAGSAP